MPMANAYFLTGKDLLISYQALKNTPAANQNIAQTMNAIKVGGYIQGVIDSAKSAGILCPDSTLTVREAEKNIVKYLQENKDMLEMAAVDVVVFSLRPKYMCK